MPSDQKAVSCGTKSIPKSTVSLRRMSESLHTATCTQRIQPGNPNAGNANVCGRQQPEIDCQNSESQSTNGCELDQQLCWETAICASSCETACGGTGWVIYVSKEQKNEIYVLTVVDRTTHCILSWNAVTERTSANLQECLEQAPRARQYYSDAFPVYDTLYYGAPYEMRTDKNETYSVEAVNADLRHYLKRLARKSRCFSRQLEALRKNIRLFVYCYNQRQLMKQRFPKYSFHLIDFLYPVC